MVLAADPRIRIIGVNYKDQPENAMGFLVRYGNPLIANGVVPPRRLRHTCGIGLFTPA
jgi:cytochrome c biogenesis protein CcmG/thiol:disulfide interchange protein DsbE